jgi:hypothetical protein
VDVRQHVSSPVSPSLPNLPLDRRLRGPLPPAEFDDNQTASDEESRGLLPLMEGSGSDKFGWGRVGKVCLSLEVLPQELAEQRPAGEGRKEPNAHPFLEEPEREALSFFVSALPFNAISAGLWGLSWCCWILVESNRVTTHLVGRCVVWKIGDFRVLRDVLLFLSVDISNVAVQCAVGHYLWSIWLRQHVHVLALC